MEFIFALREIQQINKSPTSLIYLGFFLDLLPFYIPQNRAFEVIIIILTPRLITTFTMVKIITVSLKSIAVTSLTLKYKIVELNRVLYEYE